MQRHLIVLLKVAPLFFVLFLIVNINPIYAASNGSVSWTGTATNGTTCADSSLNMTIVWTGTVNDYNNWDWIAVVTEDGDGDPLDISYFGMPIGASIPTGNSAALGAYNDISMRPVKVTLYDVGDPSSILPIYGNNSPQSYAFVTGGTLMDSDAIDPAAILPSCRSLPGNHSLTINRVTSSANDVYDFYKVANDPFNIYRCCIERLYIGTNNVGYRAYAGMRFTNITIPRYAIITNAYLQVYSLANQSVPVSASLYAERTANSAPFSAQSRPSSRRVTSHHVSMPSSSTVWQRRQWIRINNLSPIIQEIISMNNWNSGNSLSLIIRSGGTPRNLRSFSSAEGGHAPHLTITFSYVVL